MEKQVKKVTKKKTVAKEVKEEKVLKEKDTKKKKTEVKEVKKEKDTKKKNVKSTGKETKAKKEGFFKGVKNEMSKVVWPSKKNMVKYSIATILFIIFFALYFFGIEVIMAWLKSFIVVM